jgi:hypothetical protein
MKVLRKVICFVSGKKAEQVMRTLRLVTNPIDDAR